MIAVSHDRYFIKQIVNRVLEVKDGDLQDYMGDYDVSLFLSSPIFVWFGDLLVKQNQMLYFKLF